MKLRFQVLFILLFTCVQAVVTQTTEFKRYKIKSAIIEYELSGMQTGTAITYFNNYGMQEASYEMAVSEMFGETQKSETVSYLDGFWQYSLDKLTNKGTKAKNTILESLVENSDGDLESIGRKMFSSMGGEFKGKEELLGKNCDVWELVSMGTKIWVWKNIPLKSETKMMGFTITRTATKVEINVEIPPEKLAIPSGVDFVEVKINKLEDYLEDSNAE